MWFRRLGASIAERARAFAGGENRAAAILLLVGFALILAALIFFRFVAREIADSDTQRFDEQVLRRIWEFREHLKTIPVGETNLRAIADSVVQDVTALGGPAGLTLLSIFTMVYLWTSGLRKESVLTVATAVGAITLNTLLKQSFARPRPVVFEHEHLLSSSFPSGHSMSAMAIYLTHGVLLARLAPTWTARVFATGATVFMALSVACSRMYLGVHYLTDVTAGAALGLAWSLTVLCADEVFRRRRAARAVELAP